jgi:hypothetical protein
MILGNSGHGNLVASEGVGGTSTVNISNTPHMFAILSSGLYSDKIAAVLRETGCNAMDAHVMDAQPDRPFQVKLPSPLDRTFYVKDWGPGLDDREFRELYTTYGWSNKQKRNDATGAFGLGSKSPFAYTMQNVENSDGYTVETVKNGTRRVYTCYIGDSGTPQVALLHESAADADWPHGLKVTFPVQSADIDEFRQKARQVFQWFKVKPEILGLPAPLATPTFKLNGDFFGLDQVGSSGTSAVVMGNVRYPLRVERLKGLSPEELVIANLVTLFLPLGSVMMTPSREELEYTETTRTTIQKLVGEAAVEIANKIREALETPAATRWEWSRRILSYYENLPSAFKGAQFKVLLTYAGMDTDEVAKISKCVDEREVRVPAWLGDGQFSSSLGDNALEHYRVFHYLNLAGKVRRHEIKEGCTTSSHRRNRDGRPPSFSLRYLDDVTVFVADSEGADACMRDIALDRGRVPLLVVPQKKSNLQGAELYAQRIVDCEALKGIALSRTSLLPAPRAEIEKRAQAKERINMPTRLRMAQNKVEVLNLMTAKVDQIKLGDVADNEKYYLVGNNTRNSWSTVYFNNPEEGMTSGRRETQRNAHERSLRAAQEIAQYLGMNVDRVVLVPRQSTASRLKLAEQGFAPFFSVLNRRVEHCKKLQEIMAVVPKRKQGIEISHIGWLGVFMEGLDKGCQAAAQVLNESPALSGALLKARALCGVYQDCSQAEEELSDALLALRTNVIYHDNPVYRDSAVEPTYVRASRFVQEHPALGLLNLSEFRLLLSAKPEVAARVLVSVFEELASEGVRKRIDVTEATEVRASPRNELYAVMPNQELDPLVAALLKQAKHLD